MIKRHLKPGFTLIELLVGLGIFIIFLGIVSSSYISIVRTQRQANQVRKMYSETRNLMESITQDTRLSTVDYECYEHVDLAMCPAEISANISISSDGMSQYLVLANSNQTLKSVYFFDAEQQKLKIKKYVSSGNGWAPAPEFETGALNSVDGFRSLLSDNLKVTNAAFYVFPPVNPYSQAHYDKNQFQFQPKVTMFLTVESADSKVSNFKLHLQTTVSSRVYSRSS